MQTDEYRRMYELEETHWWYRGLRELILSSVVPALNASNLVLDCGCGTGIVLKTLANETEGIGIDVSSEALELCKRRGVHKTAMASTTHLPFQGQLFDVVLSLDVLYHKWVEDDAGSLEEYFRVLKPGGLVILHLPAHRLLFGGHDLVVGTTRRYTTRNIAKKLRATGLQVQLLTYRIFFLLPMIAAFRIARGRSNGSDLKSVPGILNGILLQILRIENRLIASKFALPTGSSIFCIASKPIN